MDELPAYMLSSSKSRTFSAILDHQFALNLITLGQHRRLGDKVIAELRGLELNERASQVLQIGVVPGHLSGRISRALGENGRLVVVDPIPFQLERARKRADGLAMKHSGPAARIEFIHGLGEETDYPDQTFDAIILFFILHELPVHIQRAILMRALPMLRNNGRMLIGDFSRSSFMLGKALIAAFSLLGQRYLKPFVNLPVEDLLKGTAAGSVRYESWLKNTFQFVVVEK